MKQRQGGGGVMVWAGINNEFVGPFRVADGVKMYSKGNLDLVSVSSGHLLHSF